MRSKPFVLVTALFLFSAVAVMAIGKEPASFLKPSSGQTIDISHRIDVNNIDMFVTNIGSFASNLQTGNAGLIFPKGTTKTAVYASGLWVGALVNGQIRVAVTEYTQEYVPGIILNDTSATDAPGFKVYKINKGDTPGSNPDYADWPITEGAPADSSGNPLVLGDQTLWYVYNDADPSVHTADPGSTAPLGLEIQQTVFAYDRSGALGNTVLMKFRLINKDQNQLNDTYVSLWSDPDLGGASDDLVGCDTLRNLGYCYNATNNDQLYDGTPPAVGYDLLQGPMVPGSSSETAWVSGVPHPGHKNLKMSSFNMYLSGTDPLNSLQTYQYLQGLNAVAGSGAPYYNPMNGQPTTFVVSGDPIYGTGWLDYNPADRRLMLSSGPFQMAPGDTQEVVIAILVGQGPDRLSSIANLRHYDDEVQALFDDNFVSLNPPSTPPPTLYARGFDQAVDLVWTHEMDGFSFDWGTREFHHEGYNIYQGQSASGPWKKIATFDVVDSVTLIYEDIFNWEVGAIERRLTQKGTNSGLETHLTVTYDYWRNGPLLNDSTYYYAVSAYLYDVTDIVPWYVDGILLGHVTQTHEFPQLLEAVECIPRSSSPYHLADTAMHVSGNGTGMVVIDYLDQSKITDHIYKVTFNQDRSWNLVDSTLNLTLLGNQTNQSGDYRYSIVAGMMVRVMGDSISGIKSWSFTPPEQTWFMGVDWGGSYFYGGMDIGYNFFGSAILPGSVQFVDVEVRFSPTTRQKAYDYLRGGTPNYLCIGYFECPFTIWDMSSQPARQLNAAFVDQNGTSTYDSTWGPGTSSTNREYLFIFNSNYSDVPDTFYSNRRVYYNANELDILYLIWPVLTVGHSISDLADGQVFKIKAAVPNSSSDVFAFTVHKYTDVKDEELANLPKTFLLKQNYPNPFNPITTIEYYLPKPAEVKISVYNILGQKVKTLVNEYQTAGLRRVIWDGKDERGNSVASGIYFYKLSVPEFSETKKMLLIK